MWLTLLKIFLGADMALGFLNYVAWSWLAGQPFNIWFLLLSIFATHLPDVDMIPYLLLRKRHRLISHWIFGHHPLLLVPLVAIASFAAARMWLPDRVGYTVALVTVGVVLHFLHDGMSRLGFPWLSPFSQTHFRFRGGKFSAVPSPEIDAWRERWRNRARTVEEEFSSRTPPITLPQVLFWGAGLLALVIFLRRAS
jgi:hypothetical protein